jgi:hypothetical protein
LQASACLIHPDLDLLGDGSEVRVAGGQLTESIANANHGSAIELIVGDALALEPTAIGKPIAILAPEPLLAAQFFRLFAR